MRQEESVVVDISIDRQRFLLTSIYDSAAGVEYFSAKYYDIEGVCKREVVDRQVKNILPDFWCRIGEEMCNISMNVGRIKIQSSLNYEDDEA